MDLKKLLTIYLPHELTIRKFTEYAADNKARTIIKNYFSHRQQRVKVGGQYSNWSDITRIVQLSAL